MKKLLTVLMTIIVFAALACGLSACDLFGNSGDNGGTQIQTPADGKDDPSDDKDKPTDGNDKPAGEHTHEYETRIEKPDQTSAGSFISTCTICGDKQTVSLPALSDNRYVKSADTATCTKKGSVKYSINLNGVTYMFNIETPVKHNFVNGLCSCGAFDADSHSHIFKQESDSSGHWTVCACGEKSATVSHSFDGGVITKQPTCAADGEKTFACTACGFTKTASVEKTQSHVWNGGVITKQPTCKEEGEKLLTCKVCSKTKTQSVEKSSAHSWDGGTVVTSPTCTQNGEKRLSCTVCGATKTQVTDKLSHVWSGFRAQGAEKHEYSCSVCGEKAEGAHNLENGVCTDCDFLYGFVVGQFRYSLNSAARSNTASLLGFAGVASQTASIPATINYSGTNYSVTEIGDSAFAGETALKSVTIPNTVTKIGMSAFASSGLESVSFPSSVTQIGHCAFSHSNLTRVVIPSTVKYIGIESFAACDKLSVAEIDAEIIDECAFESCGKLIDVTLGSHIKEIRRRAFLYTGLIKIRIAADIKVTKFVKDTFSAPSSTDITNFDFYGTRSRWDAIVKESGWHVENTYYLHTRASNGNVITSFFDNGVESAW